MGRGGGPASHGAGARGHCSTECPAGPKPAPRHKNPTHTPPAAQIQTSFARAVAMNGKPEVYAPLADALLRLHEWLVAREADVAQGVIRIQKQNRFEKEEVVWQGPQVGRVAVAGGMDTVVGDQTYVISGGVEGQALAAPSINFNRCTSVPAAAYLGTIDDPQPPAETGQC